MRSRHSGLSSETGCEVHAVPSAGSIGVGDHADDAGPASVLLPRIPPAGIELQRPVCGDVVRRRLIELCFLREHRAQCPRAFRCIVLRVLRFRIGGCQAALWDWPARVGPPPRLPDPFNSASSGTTDPLILQPFFPLSDVWVFTPDCRPLHGPSHQISLPLSALKSASES